MYARPIVVIFVESEVNLSEHEVPRLDLFFYTPELYLFLY